MEEWLVPFHSEPAQPNASLVGATSSPTQPASCGKAINPRTPNRTHYINTHSFLHVHPPRPSLFVYSPHTWFSHTWKAWLGLSLPFIKFTNCHDRYHNTTIQWKFDHRQSLVQATVARDWTIPFLSTLHIAQRGGIHPHNKTTLESNLKLLAHIIYKLHSMVVITYKPLPSIFKI